MPDQSPGSKSWFMTPREVAARTGFSERQLRRWRVEERYHGDWKPVYGRIYYFRRSVERWLAQQTPVTRSLSVVEGRRTRGRNKRSA